MPDDRGWEHPEDNGWLSPHMAFADLIEALQDAGHTHTSIELAASGEMWLSGVFTVEFDGAWDDGDPESEGYTSAAETSFRRALDEGGFDVFSIQFARVTGGEHAQAGLYRTSVKLRKPLENGAGG